MTDPLKMDSNNFGKSVLFYLATIIRSKFQFVQYFSLSLNISNDIPINLRTLSFELNCQMFVRSHAKLRCERGHCACLSHVCEAPEKNTIYSKYSSVDWKIQYEKFQIISQTLFFRAFYFGEGDNLVRGCNGRLGLGTNSSKCAHVLYHMSMCTYPPRFDKSGQKSETFWLLSGLIKVWNTRWDVLPFTPCFILATNLCISLQIHGTDGPAISGHAPLPQQPRHVVIWACRQELIVCFLARKHKSVVCILSVSAPLAQSSTQARALLTIIALGWAMTNHEIGTTGCSGNRYSGGKGEVQNHDSVQRDKACTDEK